ncbi:para-aminobenzoate synthase [Purpureocillium lilacinum]|uniref:aminodeoxychorismate synthase n=1 Tax=Purpureocillium lilacinum TaxID=33203 RepID=A0A179HJB4_PURLI|nr:para-aminobenzoate synthase [Purpureocillium lilacinum]OAQ90455.1 para-aminobenzoate synthase [Purpureocillium lilacinum]
MGTAKVLIIDHYDSYTNNILQLLQGTRTGHDGVPYPEWSVVIVRFDQFSWDQFFTEILPSLDAIILSPGPGTPEREADFGFNARLLQEVSIPILGICLGHQGIGTSFGAKVVHTPNIKHGQICQIHHRELGVLKDLPQGFDGVRYNSLVLDLESLPRDLEVTAWTFDPEDASKKVLMGIQHRNRPIFGTQWHPESICSAHGKQILQNFHEIVLDFWATGNPGNRWTKRPLSVDASLPQHILKENVTEPVHANGAAKLRGDGPPSSAYYIKSTSLGKGPVPQVIFHSLFRNNSPDGEIWLDSAKVRDSHSRNSYMASATFALSYSSQSAVLSFQQNGKPIRSERLSVPYWTWLDHFHREVIRDNTEAISPELLDQEAEVGQPLLQVGLLGYFGYELKRESLPGYHYVPTTEDPDTERADSELLFASTVLRLDNYTGDWTMFNLVRRSDADPIGDSIGAVSKVGLSEEEFSALLARVRDVFAAPLSPPYVEPHGLPSFVALDNEESYSDTIRAAKAAIKDGEAYELTLTTKFKAESPKVDPYALYLDLRERNPAPYSAFMHFAAHDNTILSSSPERFISVDANGVAEMKPIKGTLAVSPDFEENERRKTQLATDVKELAENLMIVDLIRSDLHNISPSSSIIVPKLLHVESYQTVHQIAQSIGGVKVIERCFPPGSMTGAPKLRAVQILDALEQRDRGIYSGSIGYICASGTVDQSVVIRTIVKAGEKLELSAGGAITWLSEEEKEWDEVMTKANAVANALPRQTPLEVIADGLQVGA